MNNKHTLNQNLFWLNLHDVGYITKFKLMYAHDNLDASIINIVNRMTDKQVDWAIIQSQNSINKLPAHT